MAGAGYSLSGGAGGSSGNTSTTTSSGFDSSGWAVTFGSGNASTASGGNDIVKYAAIAAAVGVVAWLYLRSRRRGR